MSMLFFKRNQRFGEQLNSWRDIPTSGHVRSFGVDLAPQFALVVIDAVLVEDGRQFAMERHGLVVRGLALDELPGAAQVVRADGDGHASSCQEKSFLPHAVATQVAECRLRVSSTSASE